MWLQPVRASEAGWQPQWVQRQSIKPKKAILALSFNAVAPIWFWTYLLEWESLSMLVTLLYFGNT